MVSDFVKELILNEEANIKIEKKATAIHETIKSKIPVGIPDTLSIDVTNEITDLRPENTPSMPWMSFSLMNDGPNGVNVVINERATKKAPVGKSEELEADFIAKDKIQRVWLYCERGETASVRIYALK